MILVMVFEERTSCSRVKSGMCFPPTCLKRLHAVVLSQAKTWGRTRYGVRLDKAAKLDIKETRWIVQCWLVHVVCGYCPCKWTGL